jgi:hypothetical protein
MIRYRLDDLGWYQFEWLIQSLLKAELGLGVESWGGRRDYGRDAYFTGSLHFPAKHITSDGPFLFQVKFVETANAAGAKPSGALLDAVRQEASQIEQRSKLRRWKGLKHYTLLTNSPISAALRKRIKDRFRTAIPKAQIHCLGANDICDLLDKQTNLRRSFPQLLSLRDLDDLLLDAINKETLERSRSAIECARDIVPVFVPTSAYVKAWKVLREHNFAVLEGPPEMGKTAIAWMIALTQLSTGWEALVCDGPDDFFKLYKSGSHQVFVADDAFGRTEYDPSRGGKWEGQLNHVYRLLDSKHWLIWTSRKHILERALKVMDLEGETSNFPKPAAVLVEASHLSVEEKSLILYRHARAAGLEEKVKSLVRGHARSIVVDLNFTPERIRRFVRERLPDLFSEITKSGLDPEKVSAEIREAIRNPTDRMRKTFKALPHSHKWVLVALLEAGDRSSPGGLSNLYEEHCPAEERRPFTDVCDELTESFIKNARIALGGAEIVDWIHPSYRDLVIEELVNDPAINLEFLQTMPLKGIKLAISDSGGASGERCFPLMTTSKSWKLLHDRCLQLASEKSPWEITGLLEALRSAATNAPDLETRYRLVHVIKSVCEEARKKWDLEGTALGADDLAAYCEAGLLVSPLPPVPNLEASWNKVETEVRTGFNEYDPQTPLEPYLLGNWVDLAVQIKRNEPRFLKQIGFPTKHSGDFVRLIEILQQEMSWEDFSDSSEELRDEAERLNSIAENLETLAPLVPMYKTNLVKTAKELSDKASRLEDQAAEIEPPEPDADPDSYGGSPDNFDIDGLFSDL